MVFLYIRIFISSWHGKCNLFYRQLLQSRIESLYVFELLSLRFDAFMGFDFISGCYWSEITF